MDILDGLTAVTGIGASLFGGSDSGPTVDDQYRQSRLHSEYGILKPLGTSKKQTLQVLTGRSLKGRTKNSDLKRLKAGSRQYKGRR